MAQPWGFAQSGGSGQWCHSFCITDKSSGLSFLLLSTYTSFQRYQEEDCCFSVAGISVMRMRLHEVCFVVSCLVGIPCFCLVMFEEFKEL